MKWINLLPGCLLFFFCASCINLNTIPEVTFIKGKTMGTTYRVKIVPKLSPAGEEKIKNEIVTTLDIVNKSMSTFRKDSEIVRFNDMREGTLKLSPQMYGLVLKSMDISKETSGAFDITIGPLVNLWGFGALGERRKVPPSNLEIEKVKGKVGFRLASIDYAMESVAKKNPELSFDMAAVAKGYGVDMISTMLAEKNHTNHMVEVGGEIMVSGNRWPKEGRKWKIGIEVPHLDKRKPGRILALSDISMATSGDYRNFFEYEGKRYSHTIDPVTGRPVTHNLTSVTVLARECADADAYATAILVMGPQRGLEFANNKKLKVILYIRKDDGFKELLSKQMILFLKKMRAGEKQGEK
ncbi:MAG: FAD:protein FMN transferase [Bacteriovoracaceae bacterium]|nr:FAD:protein FMN transferase [Bacteriovoracaceae bacterium]